MIDLHDLRKNPMHYQDGARLKNIDVDITKIITLDKEYRELLHTKETKRSEQKKLSKEIGPKIGALKSNKKNNINNEEIEKQIKLLEQAPSILKKEIQDIDNKSLSELKFDVDLLRLCDFNYWRDLILDYKAKSSTDFISSNKQSISVPSIEIIKKITKKSKINSIKKSFIMFIFKIYKKITN